jgi:hypothetical protein
MGDYGDLNLETCDCEFGKLGFDTCLGNIRSYEKLTGEGVTFVDTNFVRIIEQELPETFGGKSTDYQLIEVEDSSGLTHLRLLVSPRVGTVNEREVLNRFLELLKTGEDNQEWGQSGVEMWKQSGIVQVQRDYPVCTRSGKILPFQLQKPINAQTNVALKGRN